MRKKIFFILIVLIVMIGYFIGSYFVNFALRRVDPNDINSGPPACANIHDPNVLIPSKPNFVSKIWSITSKDGLKLNATYFSADKPSDKWAILVHGYGRDQRYAWDYAEEYLERGYNVITPDLRAAGTSEGIYVTMGAKESDDILLWIDKIIETDPKAKIILHGVSMGAATVMLAASKNQSPNLAAVIEDCGYTGAYEMFTDQLDKIFHLPEIPIMTFVDYTSEYKVGVKISDASPIKHIENIKIPILFIHGTEDKLVPYFMMQQLYDICDSPIKEMFTVEGAGHASAKNTNPTAYFDRVFSFLDKYLE